MARRGDVYNSYVRDLSYQRRLSYPTGRRRRWRAERAFDKLFLSSLYARRST